MVKYVKHRNRPVMSKDYIQDDTKDYKNQLNAVYYTLFQFVVNEFAKHTDKYVECDLYHRDGKVQSYLIFDGMQKALQKEGFYIYKDRVYYAHGINNNNCYEIFAGNECIGFLNIVNDMYGGVLLSMSDLSGGLIFWVWELKPTYYEDPNHQIHRTSFNYR